MLIITGTIAYDTIMDFPGKFADHILTDELKSINLSFIANKYAKRRGGTAGNVSYSLGLLDTNHTLFSVAGKDFEDYKKAFGEIGIETDHVLIDSSKYTSTGFAMTDATSNQIWGYFYGAGENIPDLQLKELLSTLSKKTKTTSIISSPFVLIGPSGAAGSMSFVKQCVALNIPYMFDPGFILTQVTNDDLTIGVEHASILIGNEYEIQLIKSRVNEYKTFAKKKIIITTLGEKGALIEDNGKEIVIRPATAKQAVDPTGAGDSWRSGFFAGYSRGYDLQTCGQMGAVTAAFVVEQFGTQEHTFTKQQFIKRYRQTYNSLIEL